MNTERRLSTHQALEAIITDGLVFRLGDRVPSAGASGGRPRTFPAWLPFYYLAAIDVVGSATRTEVELADPSHWSTLQAQVRRHHRHHPELWLPEHSPSREVYRRMRDRVLADDTIAHDLFDEFRAHAADLAVKLGLCDPTRSKRWSALDRRDVLVGDGTIVRPLYRAVGPVRTRRDGEVVPVRWDPTANLYTTGGGKVVRGHEFVVVCVRGDLPNERVILDVALVPGPGHEVATFLGCLDRVRPLLPGAAAVVYDGALRGAHLDVIMRTHGLLPIAPVTAASVDPLTGERTPKVVLIDIADHHHDHGKCEHPLYAVGGALHEGALDDTGELTLGAPLPLVRIERRAPRRTDGAWRFYGTWAIDCPRGELIVRLPVWQTPDDQQRGLNRPENLRLVPPGSPDYRRLYGLRNDAESGNRNLKRRLPDKRARELGPPRQLLGVLGHAIAVNAQARQLGGSSDT